MFLLSRESVLENEAGCMCLCEIDCIFTHVSTMCVRGNDRLRLLVRPLLVRYFCSRAAPTIIARVRSISHVSAPCSRHRGLFNYRYLMNSIYLPPPLTHIHTYIKIDR
jgi:hypothetical protein